MPNRRRGEQSPDNASDDGQPTTIRMTVDVPRDLHHRMGTLAIIRGITIRCLLLQALERIASGGPTPQRSSPTDTGRPASAGSAGEPTVRITANVPRVHHRQVKLLAFNRITTIRTLMLAALEELVEELDEEEGTQR